MERLNSLKRSEILEIFQPPDIDLKQVPVSLLAYIGDEVMSFYLKLKFLKLLKPGEVEKKVREYVSKIGQSKLLEKVEKLLTDEEKAIVKRAMNSRSATRHGNDRDYRRSTGFEALIGYLYLKGDTSRLKKILEVEL